MVFSSGVKHKVLYFFVLGAFMAAGVCPGQEGANSFPGAALQRDARAGISEEYNLSWEQLREVDKPLLEDSDQRQMVRLSLEDCIARTLEHNLDLRTGSYDPAIQMADLARVEAAFDAVLVASAQFENIDRGNIESLFYTRTTMTQTGTSSERVPTDPFTRQQDYNYAVGLQKRLATGASVEFAQRQRRLHLGEPRLYLDPFYESSLDLELRQPLLRDFGIDVNRASINAARNNVGISLQQFHLLAIQTMAEVETNYWTLVYYRQRVRIYEQLLEQATQTNERLLARTTLDASARMIARGQSLIAQTRADLLSARNDVKTQQDRLLESINDPQLRVGQMWEIITTDEPTTLEYQADLKEALERALQKRPELIAQQLSVDTTEIALGLARNQSLPRFDLVARQEMNGSGGIPRWSWEEQNRYNTVNYLVGISFEFPLGNRAARANLIKAEHQRRQERLRFENFRQQVIADVTMSWNDLNSTYQEIAARRDSAGESSNSLQAQLALEQTDAKIDATTLYLKIDALERLARAYDVLAQTIFRYNAAVVNLQRSQGTLLQYNNIKLAESPENVGALKIEK